MRLKNEVKGVTTVGQTGFTVAEILIAIFIFSVIVTTVFGSYRATSEQVEIVSRNRHLVEMGRNCLDRMIKDLKSLKIALPPLYVPPEFNSDPDPYRMVGTIESVGTQTFAMLRFTSFAHLPIQPSRSTGIARIIYYVQSNDDGTVNLHRADKLFPYEDFEPDRMDPVLSTHLKQFEVSYFDREGRSYEIWDSESESNEFSTPIALGIRLEIADDAGSQVFSAKVPLDVYRSSVQNG